MPVVTLLSGNDDEFAPAKTTVAALVAVPVMTLLSRNDDNFAPKETTVAAVERPKRALPLVLEIQE